MDTNIRCPAHPQVYLYKELLPDGRGKIVCDFSGCEWESEIFDRHEDIELRTFEQKRKEWE